MTAPSLEHQLHDHIQVAHLWGLRVRPDRRLYRTAYLAMNPAAAKSLHQPCFARSIDYRLSLRRPAHRKVLALRHELIEYRRMLHGWSYPKAHAFANKHQADPHYFYKTLGK